MDDISQLRNVRRAKRPNITVRKRNEPIVLPVSFAQQRLWFLAQLDRASEAYHISLAIRLSGALHEGALRLALGGLVRRHEALRTTFHTVDGEVFQRIGAEDVGFCLQQEDLRGIRDAEDRLSGHIQAEASGLFDLERGPLIRGRLIRLADEEHVLLITMHHIVSDGWSMGILSRELSALYGAYCVGEADPLPPLSIQYADYAVWQREWLSGERLAEQSAYWQRALSGAPAFIELPLDRRRPAQQDFLGGTVPLVVDETLTAGLHALSRRHGMTLFMTILAGWSLVLSRLSNQEDIVIGTPSANRGRMEIEGLIGFFVNTLALRIDLSGAPTVEQVLKRVKNTALEAQANQDLPFEQVVELVKPVRSLNHTPIFQVMFAWQNIEEGVLDLPGLKVERVRGGDPGAQFDLTLGLGNARGRIVGRLNYAKSLFDRETIERYAGYLKETLSEMVSDASRPAAALSILSEAERYKLLVEWNATQREYPRDKCIHELFEAQVERDPEAMAVVYEGQSLSYGELNARANRLAHYLRELGVKPDARVGICVERSLEMLVGLLAILKAGGCYVPLDPEYPAERLAFMLQDAAPEIVLTHAAARGGVDVAINTSGVTSRVVNVDADAAHWAIYSASNPSAKAIGLTSDHLAYVIYTSGSTGQPKGVMVEHKNVVCRMHNTDYAPLSPQDVMAQVSNISFDAATWEIWGALLTGARLVGLKKEVLLSAELFSREIIRAGLNALFLTTALFNMIVRDACDALRQLSYLLFGGERVDPSFVAQFLECRRSVHLLHVYGPTETTTYATSYAIEKVEANRTVPIGRPISNARIYLLDGLGNPVPLGVAGEIYIGGAGVARGYLNRAELTAERFIASPFVEGDRLYRTGDLGRYLPDGNIEFLGRNDFQVKIRGFRIELGEIETRLMSHPLVREAVVVAREDEAGDKRLIAYYTVSPDSGEIGAEALRAHLSAALPEYMVPAAYVRLDALPLTTNGKLDRKALPAPEGDAYSRGVYEAPVGAVETALAQIWSEELGVQKVGRRDNFFDLGGHSLLAIRVLERMRRAGLQSDVRALFTTPVLGDLAGRVGAGGSRVEVPANLIPVGCERITPELLPLVSLTQDQIDGIAATVSGGSANVQDIYPLAPLQEGILFHHLLDGAGDPYLLWNQLSFPDRAGVQRYVAALDAVIARHDILRTGIVWEGLSEAVQVVWRRASIAVEEVSIDPTGGDVAEQLKERFNARHYRLDVRCAPMMRIFIAHDRWQGRWVMMQLSHHLCMDHTTLEVMQAEIAAHLLGNSSELPAPSPFRNLVAQARLGVSREEHEAFFREMLGEVAEPTAPFGLMDARGDGSGIAEARVMLGEELARRIRSKARSMGVSAASVCHVAWALVVSRCSGQEEPVFGTVLFGRMQGGEDADRTLGLFINTLPVRISLGELEVQESVLKTHRLLAELMHHEHASLALAQRCSAVPAPAPLFTSLLNYTHSAPRAKDRTDQFAALEGIRFLGSEERTNYPITCSVEDLGEALGLAVLAVASVGAERVSAMMERALEQLVEALETDPAQPVGRLDVLPPAERYKLLVEWNATQREYPRDKCIHELFEAQVERDPEAMAVVYEGQSLSYGELNARANRLAHYLRELGVKPDARVGICVERSLEMVVGLLAILKAGGCYVPLDPKYPAERLAFMLQDAAPEIVLTHAAAWGGLDAVINTSGVTSGVVNLGADAAGWATYSASNPSAKAIGLTSDHLAYVIYTSGSTGQPKGVMVEHKNVVRLFAATEDWFHFDAQDVWTLFHSFAFDFSVWELWGALLHGGKLVVVPQIAIHSPAVFYRLICDEGVTILNQTPSAFRSLMAEQIENKKGHSLRSVIFGGETLEIAALLPWYQDAHSAKTQLTNMYGITETTVHVTRRIIEALDLQGPTNGSQIGRRIPDLRIYLLDGLGNPVPLGVAGEIYIGGAGVARGYLNRAELTAERFIASPFVEGDRLYRTGDLGRYLPDGNIEFLGRNDFQVKIRGFRVELGEIETRLMSHPLVREAVVVAREDEAGDKRLIAYYTVSPDSGEIGAEALRAHLSAALPEYMVPAAYVRLDALPLTTNGKLDRKALPAPEGDAYSRGVYEAPVGAVETALAQIWSEELGVQKVGRRDNFFDLGGHSLLAIRVLERMRRAGLQSDVRALFTTPVLGDLAGRVGAGGSRVEVPANLIPVGCERITPELLPLVSLTQDQIDGIAATVSGGSANVQDIYPLAPLQEGILFHHLLDGAGDPYLLWNQLSFPDRAGVQRYVAALDAVIARHDILRTGIVWEGLSEAVQVVWRRASIAVEEVSIDPTGGDVAEQLKERFNARHYRLDVRCAPMMRIFIAHDRWQGRWVMMQLSHHLCMDHTTLEVMQAEIAAHLLGNSSELPAPSPFRNLVAQARLGVSREEHEAFFREMLGEVAEPTAPFGLMDARGDGSGIAEARVMLGEELARRIRSKARSMGVSAASVCHVAWALVVSRCSGQEEPVFGTVLFGRMQGGEDADRTLGLFINTLPVRISLGELEVQESVLKTHRLLAELMHHEHASLALAQRCSAVPAPAPLFTSLLNYTHSAPRAKDRTDQFAALEGIRFLGSEERTNYPITCSVEDLGEALGLAVLAVASVGAERVSAMMERALEQLVEALETDPAQPVGRLDVLPPAERYKLLVEWNATQREYPRDKCIHELFEAQVERDPEAMAVVYEGQSLSYGELNARANRLAHYLRDRGVGPGARVGICVERGIGTVLGMLGILKAGGAYVPMDPRYPADRLGYMVSDSDTPLVLVDAPSQRIMKSEATSTSLLDLQEDEELWEQRSAENLDPASMGLRSDHLAYVIYTSGSTGQPKGVMVEHGSVVNYLVWQSLFAPWGRDKSVLHKISISFDASVIEIFGALVIGSQLVIAKQGGELDFDYLARRIEEREICTVGFVPTALNDVLSKWPNWGRIKTIRCGGELLSEELAARFFATVGHDKCLVNVYGPTETTIVVSCYEYRSPAGCGSVPIGKPISNVMFYVLDKHMEVVPVGVEGELFIGGDCVARGYLGQQQMTNERFVLNPFGTDLLQRGRLYKTGDRARWLPSGNVEFLGRSDQQVKIRGYRIELGEIEGRLLSHPSVHEAVVVAREDAPGDKRLIAYYTVAAGSDEIGAESLYSHLSSALPEYMVPAAYVRLDALPLTMNGKLDRKELPAPAEDAYNRGVYEAPMGVVETTLAQIWEQLLQVDRVGRQDDFFALGGQSVLALKMVSRIGEATGIEIGIRTIFESSTLKGLAEAVGSTW